MALGNDPKQDWACCMILTPRLGGDCTILSRDLIAPKRSLSFTYGGPVKSCSSLVQMYFGKRRSEAE